MQTHHIATRNAILLMSNQSTPVQPTSTALEQLRAALMKALHSTARGCTA